MNKVVLPVLILSLVSLVLAANYHAVVPAPAPVPAPVTPTPPISAPADPPSPPEKPKTQNPNNLDFSRTDLSGEFK